MHKRTNEPTNVSIAPYLTNPFACKIAPKIGCNEYIIKGRELHFNIEAGSIVLYSNKQISLANKYKST